MAAKIGAGASGRHAARQNSDMNVTPFVDVMLVLLIIFMVAAPLATKSVKIDLPPNAIQSIGKPPTSISITRSGVWVAGHPTSLTTLSADLARTLRTARPTQESIVIRADRDVDYQQFMAVVNQLKLDGYNKLGLIAENAPAGA